MLLPCSPRMIFSTSDILKPTFPAAQAKVWFPAITVPCQTLFRRRFSSARTHGGILAPSIDTVGAANPSVAFFLPSLHSSERTTGRKGPGCDPTRFRILRRVFWLPCCGELGRQTPTMSFHFPYPSLRLTFTPLHFFCDIQFSSLRPCLL